MDKQCTRCQSNAKYFPAGLSKTKVDAQGNPKPFSESWRCQNDKCKFTEWGKKSVTATQMNIQKSQGDEQVLKGLREIYSMVKEIRDMLESKRDNLDPENMDF